MTGKGFAFGFGPEFWWWGIRGERGRRPGRRVWFESGDLKYVILKLLCEKPMHGYEVMKALEEQTQGCYKPSPGAVYPTLQWLEDEGLVRGVEVEGKKVYEITDAGRRFLDEHKSTVEEIFERIEETIESLFTDPMPEVTRLVGRIVPQAYKAAWKLRDDAAKRARLREILEGAARELETLASQKP